MAIAAAGHLLHLVLPLLLLVVVVVGVVLADDLTETELEEARVGDIPEARNRHCLKIGGRCYKTHYPSGLSKPCPPGRPNNKTVGAPFCNNKNRHCCYPDAETTKKGCSFGGSVYPDKAYLEACFELKCDDGTWEYTGRFDNNCGNCIFGGEPLIYTFDTLSNYPKPIITNNNLTGEFIMAQPGLAKHAEFGVHGHFTDDPNTICEVITTCVNGVTYHEDGITIRITLTNGASYSYTIIKVFVDGKPFTIGNTVKYVYGTSGAILVFKHNHIDGGGEKCISVIGTKGLTVALCEKSESTNGWPWAYIYAMPALIGNPLLPRPNSQLYGLCNTWTGVNQDCFTEQGGDCVDSSVWQCGTGYDDVDGKDVPALCDDVADTWLA